MTSKPRQATVYLYLPGEGHTPAGLLEVDADGRNPLFTYGRRYLLRPNAIPVDPVRLPLTMTGHARPPGQSPMFNALRDAAPDRWGRKVLALRAGQSAETLSEFDILTAEHSRHRIGALAFGPSPTSGPRSLAAWAGDGRLFVTNLERIAELARIIRQVDATPESELDELRERLPRDAFLRAFTSLFSPGGARPKAMIELDGRPWIAKFSKSDDLWNEPLVEHATMTLAAQCGVEVAETRTIRVGDMDVLLVRRFDREPDGTPLHFVSAFTLLDIEEDGDWKSYQALAQAARRHGDERAGEELFRRMVFNACCANTDDHPRNHAFFARRVGVRLTPAYDVTPIRLRLPEYELALRCGASGRVGSLDNLLSDPAPFGLSPARARDILDQIVTTMRPWRDHFASLGVANRDIEELGRRFLWNVRD